MNAVQVKDSSRARKDGYAGQPCRAPRDLQRYGDPCAGTYHELPGRKRAKCRFSQSSSFTPTRTGPFPRIITQKEIAQIKKAAQEETEASKNAAEKEIAEVKKAAEKEIESIKKVTEKQVKAAQKAKEKAEDKAEANSLSHYIVQALQERKERKNTKNDGEDK